MRIKLRLLLTLIGLALLLSACGEPQPTFIPPNAPTIPPAVIPTVTAAKPAVTQSSAPLSRPGNPTNVVNLPMVINPEKSPTLAPKKTDPTVKPSAAPSLWVNILTPEYNAVVNTSKTRLAGQASKGAVLSINDEIIKVGSDQTFFTTLTLQEGPNVIEIVASDVKGNEMAFFWVINYEP